MTDQPLTIAEAAAALGLTREAVRSRLRRGTLRGEQVAGQWPIVVAQLRDENTYLRLALERSQTGEAELRRLLAMNVPALPAGAPELAGTGTADSETPAGRGSSGGRGGHSGDSRSDNRAGE